MERLYAPWTTGTVIALNEYQKSGRFHPFTCGKRGDAAHSGSDSLLVAQRSGWRCSVPGCDYYQDWAHPFMAEKVPT